MLDVRLVNAGILTMDPAHPEATQLGIWRGRVVGVDDDVAGLPARRVVDLGGATVLPGFVDAHVHLVWAGLREITPSIAPCADRAEVLRIIGEAARRRAPGDWVDVAGYDQRPLGGHLTAAELDSVAGGRKVFVVHDSGHACVVSGAVLALLPPGTPHENGMLAEQGMADVRRLRQPYAAAELADAVERGGRTCLAEGVTAAAEAGIGGGLVSHSPVELEAYLRRPPPIRMRLMVAGALLRDPGAHPADGIPRAMDLGLRTGFGGPRLGIGALKIFTDGGMMARTAALTEPYLDAAGAGHAGDLFTDEAWLRSVIVDGHRAGWQLAVHAIGDRAIDVALDSIAEAQRAHPRPDARHRIEHAGLVRPDHLPRFAELGVLPVVQPNFLWYFGDDYAAVLGPGRAPWLYRGRGFLDAGVRLVGSSDRPVTPGAPLRSIQFMVTRRTATGATVGPGEAITVEEALRAFTADAAYACHWEDDLGSIRPGLLADLVVLGADPRRVPPDAIGDIEVLATLVDGEVAHGSLP
ncbi:MAG TPA: amidohydrolase [Pseudonocardiaceae bacterium]